MSESIIQLWIELLIYLPVAVGVLTLAWWRDWIGPDSMRGVSARQTGLTILDLMAGLLIMFVGMVIFQWLALRWGWLSGEEVVSPGQQAIRSLLGQLLSQGPVVAYLLIRCGQKTGGVRELGIWPRRWWVELTAGVVGTVAVWPLVVTPIAISILVGYGINGQLPPQVGHPLLVVIQQAQGWALLGNLASAILVAPMLEELLFRGLVQSSLVEMPGFAGRRWLVTVASGSLFMLVHVGGVEWQTLAGLFSLGLVLAWLYERTGSLWPCFVIHMGFNSYNVGLALLKAAEPRG